tara:strand:+ start:255805 stop:256236 length:432 start_codon:yes stop_codon:yes gene_type:complete
MVLQENPPFEVTEASFQKWFGGTQEAGKGIHFNLSFSEISEDVIIQKIYFRGKEEILKQNPKNPNEYLATFIDKPKEDVVLDSNPVKEMDNPRPSLVSEIPFELKAIEAVIQYQKDNKVFYYKIENIPEKDEVAYPSSKPDDN